MNNPNPNAPMLNKLAGLVFRYNRAVEELRELRELVPPGFRHTLDHHRLGAEAASLELAAMATQCDA